MCSICSYLLHGGKSWPRLFHMLQQLYYFYRNFYVSRFLPKPSSVNISHFIFVFRRSPRHGLLYNKFVVIPYLNLILGCVTTNQKLSVIVVDRITSNVRTEHWFYRFSLSNIPQMNHWVPASWNNSVVIDEFDGKYSIWMPSVIPLSTAQISTYTFCGFFTKYLL